MRITMFDRWLLLVALLCFLFAGTGEMFGDCDQECRHVNWYAQDDGSGSTICWYRKYETCYPCVAAYNGSCDTTNKLQDGTCKVISLNFQAISGAKDCSIKCGILPASRTESTAGMKDKFVYSGELQVCTKE